MQLSWLVLEETLLSHCSELTLVWRSVGIPKNSWISCHQLTSSIVKRWWSKTSTSLRKILCINLYLPMFEGLRKGKQGMSRSYLKGSWAKDWKTRGFYTARKWVHCHCRCVSEKWNFLYAFQRPKNVFFANALLVRKFQKFLISFWIVWRFTCSCWNHQLFPLPYGGKEPSLLQGHLEKAKM